MKGRTLLLLMIGTLLLLTGIVFFLQGSGILGPVNSFMHDSSAWMYNGIFASAVGLILILLALVLARTAKSAIP